MTTPRSRATAATALIGVALCSAWVVLGHPPPARPAAVLHLLVVASLLLGIALAVAATQLARDLAHQIRAARQAHHPEGPR